MVSARNYIVAELTLIVTEVSLGLASQVPGTEIILCTDGLSNVGVGSFDKDDLEKKGKKKVRQLVYCVAYKELTASLGQCEVDRRI